MGLQTDPHNPHHSVVELGWLAFIWSPYKHHLYIFIGNYHSRFPQLWMQVSRTELAQTFRLNIIHLYILHGWVRQWESQDNNARSLQWTDQKPEYALELVGVSRGLSSKRHTTIVLWSSWHSACMYGGNIRYDALQSPNKPAITFCLACHVFM